MSRSRIIKIPLLVMIMVSGSLVGLVGLASASQQGRWTMDGPVSGGGSTGTGSLAVAAFFSVRASSGVGAFSGTVGGVQTLGLFSLTVGNPANAPVLSCPNGQVSAGGSVTSGSFQGEQVLIAGCIGFHGPLLADIYHSSPISPEFSAKGTFFEDVTVSSSSIIAGFAAAGVTTGSGTAGPGTVYTAEADAFISDGSVLVGGAYISDLAQTGNTWVGNRASVQPGCTLTTTGMTASNGSFPNRPVRSTYTLLTCPPENSGPQDARFVYVVGGSDSPVYKGTGTARMDPYKNF